MKRGLIRRPSVPIVSRWDPFDEIRQTQEHLNQLFKDFMPSIEWKGGDVFSPLVDIQEKDDSVVVTTDLPGVDKGDVDIRIGEGYIEISAESKKEEESEKEGYVQKERSYSRFSRAVSLPSNVTEEGAKAKLEDGVLTVTLPKTKTAEKPKIEIE
ncbi:HSP20 family protein [Methanohalophilus levihalophilus]|uniref:Hsp20/alpha crystallin family protein n=1 Tax=Methanohalophilus levihalophilus TaxID=1431282 RepID=UPI001AE44EC8|nr:Hsp20/alpha crystallin family protein [Methanohalophilus levihalophilus]MBP2030084.1 HSP20 family protein [Methanohalophilus levihalophilus]